MTREELAKELRGLALFNGHQFQEAEPAYDLADEVIRLREQELQEPSAKRPSLGKSPAQGNAAYTRELEAAAPLQRHCRAGRHRRLLPGTDRPADRAWRR